MKKVYSFLALLGAAAFLSFSLMGKGSVAAHAEGEKNVPISSIDAWKFGGAWDIDSSYCNEGVKMVVPGADTVGGDAWWHRPLVTNTHEADLSLDNALSLDAYGQVSIEFSVGFFNDDGSEITHSGNGYAFDVAFYSQARCWDEDIVARLRIWTDSAGARNGSHSTVVYSNGWGNNNNGKWIIGDATLSSHFYLQLDKENFLSSYANGSEVPIRLADDEWVENNKGVLDGVDNVWLRFEGDNGFTKSTSIILRSINGQSLANDGTNFIDDHAPVFLKSSVPATITQGEEYTLPVDAFDLLGSVSYSMKIGNEVIEGRTFTPQQAGELTVQLIATDAVGNSATKDIVFTVVSNISAPEFVTLPVLQDIAVKPLQKVEIDMPEIIDSTGTAEVVLKVYHGEELFTTLEKNVNDKFVYVFPADFEAGEYTFVFEATNSGGTTKSDPVSITITMEEIDSVPFIAVPDTKSIAVYTEKGLKCETLNNWRSFYFGTFDFSEGFDFKFIVDDASVMENAAVALHIINADDPSFVAEYRVWASFSGGDRPTNVYISTNGWETVTDITDTGWIKRGVDDVENQYHMAYSVEDTFMGERLGGMQQVDAAVEQLKTFFASAPSANFKAYLSLGKDGAPSLNATITEINGQKFAAPITWNNAYLTIKSVIPEVVTLDQKLDILAYAKDIRQECAIHLGGKNADNEDIDVDFVDGVASYTFNKVGDYTLVISTVGANGQKVEITKEVTCKSSTAEIEITVAGNYEATYAAGSEITILDATYSENVVSHSITISEPGNKTVTVNPGDKYTFAKPGLYKIIYTAQDDAVPTPNEAVEEFVINVPDAANPVVTVTGATTGKVNEEISVTISVEDDSEVELSVSLSKPDGSSQKLTGTEGVYKFTPTEAGKYVIKVVAEDLYGNKETVNYEITVSAAEPTPGPGPVDPEPQPEPQPEQKSGGCGGSIIAASALLSSISLLGVALLSIKKRK